MQLEPKETLTQYKDRLIKATGAGTITAEDDFEEYEDAVTRATAEEFADEYLGGKNNR